MSNADTETTIAGDSNDEETSLRQRIEDDPRPAMRWLGVAAVLVVLEFGRIMDGALTLGSAVSFVLGGIVRAPGWVGGNIGGVISPIAGAIVSDIFLFVFFLGVSALATKYLLPWSIADAVDTRISRHRIVQLERVALAAFLTAFTLLAMYTPLGAIIRAALAAPFEALSSLPTITSRELISNQGHRTPDGGWEGTFLGLSPAVAWAIRVVLVYAYAFAAIAWVWNGYNVYREHYRQADWTPRDDTFRRVRNHYWGMFGIIVVLLFIVTALWAPAIGPATAEENIYSTYQHEVEYLSDDGTVETALVGEANLDSRSNGQNTVGPLSYDEYDRWAPLGTTPNGQDMLTNIAYGAQTSLIIGLLAIGIGGTIAVTLSLLTAYYKGLVDIMTVIASDTIISIPAFLLVMMISVLFNQGDHFLAEPMDGAILLGLVFAFVYWPGMWRSIRGPSLQVAEEEWVDAAKSYGQTPANTMRKHMAPYIAGYIMIYGSLLLGGVIIFTAALSFLGLGIGAPTPEWGRLISDGQYYVSSSSWHVATIPGLMIVLVVTAFNALGDGLRDAIDPEADTGGKDDTNAAAAGGGG